MKFEDYPDKVLVAIMHNGDKELNEKIKKILESRTKGKDYRELYIKYISSEKDAKKSLAELLATHLCNDLYYCEEDVFIDILHHLDIDYIWMLAVSSKNLERKKMAKEMLYNMLDDSFKQDECKNKVGLKKIKINKKGKRKK